MLAFFGVIDEKIIQVEQYLTKTRCVCIINAEKATNEKEVALMIDEKRNKILVAMSGGVDSAVTALLLSQSGVDCVGGCMLLRKACSDDAMACSSTKDAEDAAMIAKKLGFPFYTFDFSSEFNREVIDRFADAYENGRTPNPCIDCNRYLKFERLFGSAAELGCDGIATGHYARVERDDKTGRYLLKKATDLTKDQSYVLWALSQEQLARTSFPLGELTKAEVRNIAEENALINAHKKDSQDICFIPDGKYAEFLERYRNKTYAEGDFLSTDGRILGKHKGIIRYTVGQKKGLGLVLPEPLYVCAVDPIANTVTLGKSEELFSTKLIAKGINLISVESISSPMRVKAKVRYRHTEEWATVTQLDSDSIEVIFDTPQRAITKGQSVVLYDGDTVVGGGLID